MQPTAAKPVVDSGAVAKAVANAERNYRLLLTRQAKAFRTIGDYLERSSMIATSEAEAAEREARRAVPEIPAGEILRKENSPRESNRIKERARDAPHANPRLDIVPHNGDGDLTAPMLKVLSAMAQFEAIGVSKVTPRMIAGWLGVKASTGTFKEYVRYLKRFEAISEDGDSLQMTEMGRERVPGVEAPATTEKLLDRAASVFGSTCGAILRAAHAAYPNAVEIEDVAAQLGVKAGTGTFKEYLRDLGKAGMVVRHGDAITAASWLFLEGANEGKS